MSLAFFGKNSVAEFFQKKLLAWLEMVGRKEVKIKKT